MGIVRCPSCDIVMTPQSRAGITVDICLKCKGVWLDPGEIDILEMQGDVSKNYAAEALSLSRPGLLTPGLSERLFWRSLGGLE